MANSKISALAAATTPLAGAETLPIVQSGATTQVSVSNLTAGRAVGVLSLSATQNITGGSLYSVSGFSGYRASGASVSSPGDASMYYNSATGQTLQARAGSSYDWSLINPGNANYIAQVPTGTLDFRLAGGNFIIGTAAKGINFTANTGAAGMTSQLLNWYEEGTYTPTITASSGTLTTVTASGNYTRIGRQITVNISITLTNIGTASGALIATLPYTCGLFPAIGTGREDQNTGVSLQPRIPSGVPGSVYIVTYANATVIATGNVAQVTITYFV